MSLMTSVAWMTPRRPGSTPEHSTFGAGGHKAGRRRFRIEAAVTWAIRRGVDAGLSFKAEDRGINIGLAAEHAGVIDEIAGGEVVGAVGDNVKAAQYLQRILAGELGVEALGLHKGIDGVYFVDGRVELGAANIAGMVDDLALQIGVIDSVEIDQPEGSDACGSKVEHQRRAEPACSNTEHTRGLQLLLPCHGNFGHDQVPRVAQNFLIA